MPQLFNLGGLPVQSLNELRVNKLMSEDGNTTLFEYNDKINSWVDKRHTGLSNVLSKNWVEVLFSQNTDTSAHINNWLTDDSGTLDGYRMISHNTTIDGRLDYTQLSSSIVYGNFATQTAPFTSNEIIVVSKSYTNQTLLDAIIAGRSYIQDYRSATGAKIIDHFLGIEHQAEALNSFGNSFDTYLGYRDGSKVLNAEEWHIQDSATDNAQTLLPRWGYRIDATYGGAKSNNSNISTTNILSVWLSVE